MANFEIDYFLTQRHGEKEKDWKRTMEFFLKESPNIKRVLIEETGGETLSYFFDLTRALGITKRMVDDLFKKTYTHGS